MPLYPTGAWHQGFGTEVGKGNTSTLPTLNQCPHVLLLLLLLHQDAPLQLHTDVHTEDTEDTTNLDTHPTKKDYTGVDEICTKNGP